MASQDNTALPVAVQKTVLADTLDSTLLGTFLIGEQLVIIICISILIVATLVGMYTSIAIAICTIYLYGMWS